MQLHSAPDLPTKHLLQISELSGSPQQDYEAERAPERSHRTSPPLGGSTALPNALFDALLPTLSDSQLRVLLVVARSTLGWKEGAGRKERDWLSHAQLQKRTGRSGAPVSRAIDALVKRDLLVVQDEAGMGKGSASERRALRGNLFFRLGDGLLAGSALPDSAPHVATNHRATTLQTKDEGDDEGGENVLSPFSVVLSPEENTPNHPSSLL